MGVLIELAGKPHVVSVIGAVIYVWNGYSSDICLN